MSLEEYTTLLANSLMVIKPELKIININEAFDI